MKKIKRMELFWIAMSIIGGLLVLAGGIGYNLYSSKESERKEDEAKKERKIIDEKVSKSNEVETFFRENDFSILKKYFPDGCLIIKQKKDGSIFSKSTYNDAIIFENSKNKIVFDENRRATLSRDIKAVDDKMKGVFDFGVVSYLDLSENAIFEKQFLPGIIVGDQCEYFLLIENNHSGYTFAVGREKCGDKAFGVIQVEH